MNLSKLTSTDLRQVLGLLEQREALVQQLAQVDRQITVFEGAPAKVAATAGSAPVERQAAAAKPAKSKPGQRRRLRFEIIEQLQQAGTAGLTVAQLAERLGLTVNRVYTWFYSTGKSNKAIQKVGNAHYRWVG
jgi:hypothetical protein